VVAPGQEVDLVIDDPDAVDTWSVRTSSDHDVVVVRLSGNPAVMGALSVQVLLPGRVVVGRLEPPRAERFSIALSGRAAQWALELSLRERRSAPVRYRMSVERLSVPGAGVGRSCADALRARGVDAWIASVPSPPDRSGIAFPGLGAIALSATPPRALTAASPGEGAPPVLHARGGTVLQGELAALGCDPGHVQVNLWDTGKGKPPAMVIADASGRRLCGNPGQPSCPSNPSVGRWVTWALSSPSPIRSLSLECDELFLSSIVIR
jgi:hypothetical protein